MDRPIEKEVVYHVILTITLPLQQPQGTGASFNFEISKCTEATVRNFMQPPVIMNSDKTLVKWYKKQWLKNQNL